MQVNLDSIWQSVGWRKITTGHIEFAYAVQPKSKLAVGTGSRYLAARSIAVSQGKKSSAAKSTLATDLNPAGLMPPPTFASVLKKRAGKSKYPKEYLNRGFIG